MPQTDIAAELQRILAQGGAALFGFADLRGLTPPPLAQYDHAVSLALAMEPGIMATVIAGPNQAYAELYARTNERLNELCGRLEAALKAADHQAWAVPASVRSDPVNIRGDFPHKTAATRAGLGWIGKNAQLITHSLGPWLRLGTVLTDCPLPVAAPVERSFCGDCEACVRACPADALIGASWTPGLARELIFSPQACDAWKKENYRRFHGGHVCGICTAACPFGQKTLRR